MHSWVIFIIALYPLVSLCFLMAPWNSTDSTQSIVADLITLAHRPIEIDPIGIFFHYSLQKWRLECQCPCSGPEPPPYPHMYNINDWIKGWSNIRPPCTITKTGSLELMWDETFSICVFTPPPIGICVPSPWRLSTIHTLQLDSGIELAWIAFDRLFPFDATGSFYTDGLGWFEMPKGLYCWDEMVQLAKSYKWAWKDTLGEVFFDPENNNWIQWEYQIPVLDGLKARNSNTFARYILQKVYGKAYELPVGSHPGAPLPEDSTNPGYCGTPFKEGSCVTPDYGARANQSQEYAF